MSGRTAQRRTRGTAAVVTALLAAVYLYRNLWVAWRELARRPSDFRHYHDAARELAAGGTPYSVVGFDYPPLPALLVLPLAGLGELAARRWWFVLGQLSLLAAAGLLWRLLCLQDRAAAPDRAGAGRSREAVAALLVVAAAWGLSGTLAENLVLGQVGPLLLLAVVAGLWSLSRGGGPLGGAALGAAAALKLWPGVVFGAHLLAGDRRGLAAGAAVLLLLLVLPWAFLLTLPPPHLPPAAGYWMGTPALLNFSLPAVALRLADPPAAGEALPRDWVAGNDPRALALPPARRALGAGVAGATLALGGAVLAWRWRRRAGPGSTAAASPGHQRAVLAAAALVALALAASPISWYHYRLLQLPGVALLAWRRRRRPAALAGLVLLAAGLTWTQALVGLYVGRYGWTAAQPALLWALTSLVPPLDLLLFSLLVKEIE